MRLVEQHRIDRHDPRFAAIDAAAFPWRMDRMAEMSMLPRTIRWFSCGNARLPTTGRLHRSGYTRDVAPDRSEVT